MDEESAPRPTRPPGTGRRTPRALLWLRSRDSPIAAKSSDLSIHTAPLRSPYEPIRAFEHCVIRSSPAGLPIVGRGAIGPCCIDLSSCRPRRGRRCPTRRSLPRRARSSAASTQCGYPSTSTDALASYRRSDANRPSCQTRDGATGIIPLDTRGRRSRRRRTAISHSVPGARRRDPAPIDRRRV